MYILKTHARFCEINYNSLEYSIVKEAFVAASSIPYFDKRMPIIPAELTITDFQIVHKKPITADETELNENNRSHSAKLRTIERI